MEDNTGSLKLDEFWERMLSRDPIQVRAAFRTVSISEQNAILAHLKRMTSEQGWHPEQVKSAQAALDALDSKSQG